MSCQPNEMLCNGQCLVLDPLCGCPQSTSVSFANDIQPLWNSRCGPSCHISGAPGGLNLVGAYPKTVNVTSNCLNRPLIDPFAPSNSHIYSKLSGVNIGCGSQMPLAGGFFNANELALVRNWICQGAPNN